MDWLRSHLPSYTSIRTASSMASSLSSSQSNNNPAAVPRLIVVNAHQQQRKYCNNKISTCKYNILTFFPRFLLEQFRRYSNVFFLCIAVLQQIPEVSPTGRYTTAVPFLIILIVSAIKEIFEDIKRRRMDIEVNNYKVQVLRGNKFETSRWRNLLVGQIVKVVEGHHFPADLVLLASSEPMGMAYIETAQLDGETNLKIRQALQNTASFTTPEQLKGVGAEVECEPPNRKVNEFTGTLRIGNDRMPLSITQLLLRGAKLKNCKWIFGAVVYAGHDSRLLMNSTTPPLKDSRVEALTNKRIIVLFLVLIAITVTSVIGAEMFNRFALANSWYLGQPHSWNFLWNALTFFILYNNLIPISLQVTLEVIRFFQAWYINQDLKMYDEASDTAATARTSNLNEELGQVQYLMTDKTGTLTRNVMKFKKCQIGSKNYGDDEREEFDDQSLSNDLQDRKENWELIEEFLRMMATCHTAVPDHSEEGELIFQATSPDEGALVRGAQTQGYTFHTRRPDEIVIGTPNGDLTFKLLNTLEFNSNRKRMSVILRDSDNRIKLYCKGADDVIFERLSAAQNPENIVSCCHQALDEFAHKGYRTLCFAMAELEQEEYDDWLAKYREASTSLENREEKVTAVAELVERELQLIAVTAIEDKLQENVPQTIKILLEAEIHIWMLTGDKLETAVQIAQSSSICSKNTKLMKIGEKSFDAVLEKLQLYTQKSQEYLTSNVEFALVIEGASLHHAVIGEARRVFSELIVNCHSVICCRMTPIQKAEIVEIVKVLKKTTVLAVGDGANDVAMIQAASVGVGIVGEEGLQAASASDYTIAQFQYLGQLLLVHGTWNYERTVKVILYSFYKNICLYIIELWFAFFSAFSGVTIFERWTIAMFNVIFTAFPPVIIGLFDRPISQRLILRHPQLYQSFQKMAFSDYRFYLWIGISLWHSLVLFFLGVGFYGSGVVWETGNTGGWLMFGNALYSFVVVTVCLKAMLECDSWTWIIGLSCVGSVLSWFLFLSIYSWVFPFSHLHIGADMKGMFTLLVSSMPFWMAFVCVPITTLFFDFTIKSFCATINPSPRERYCLKEKRKTVGCHITDMEGAHFDEVRQFSNEMIANSNQSQQSSPLFKPSTTKYSENSIPTVNPIAQTSTNCNSQSAFTLKTVDESQTGEGTAIITNPNFVENYGALESLNKMDEKVNESGCQKKANEAVHFTRKHLNGPSQHNQTNTTGEPLAEQQHSMPIDRQSNL